MTNPSCQSDLCIWPDRWPERFARKSAYVLVSAAQSTQGPAAVWWRRAFFNGLPGQLAVIGAYCREPKPATMHFTKGLGKGHSMRWKYSGFLLVTAACLLAAPAFAQQPQKPGVSAQGNTVSVSRDENGRTRTRIIVQRRSYLDPGTEPLPSERNVLDYIDSPTQRADSPLNNTAFGNNQSALPGPFTLPSRHNPWLD